MYLLAALSGIHNILQINSRKGFSFEA